jgi:HD-like signal output (HDOD) protein
MQAWNMPEEIITAIQQHHNVDYQGSHEAYSWLVTVSDQILKSQNMSDADTEEVSHKLCEQLGLEEDDVFLAMDEVLQSGEELEFMVKSLAA